ncbi:MAG: hypothetical protein H6767_03740 [Candidatus Peribacteria bacterium]|nr:MAG: hypothetical protein H6767_03740 [Candidatus Peribacteria bacterium]
MKSQEERDTGKKLSTIEVNGRDPDAHPIILIDGVNAEYVLRQFETKYGDSVRTVRFHIFPRPEVSLARSTKRDVLPSNGKKIIEQETRFRIDESFFIHHAFRVPAFFHPDTHILDFSTQNDYTLLPADLVRLIESVKAASHELV